LTPALNGILAGLVGITANCATVRLEGALVIGAVSGLFYNLASELLERFHIDDVVLVRGE
jgi:Amt family ammonium transporter